MFPQNQQVRVINPYAPPSYNGMLNATPDGFVDVDFKIPFDVTLTSGQDAPNLARDVPTDADFIWRATIAVVQTGEYSVQFADSQGYQFSNGLIHRINVSASAIAPSVNGHEIVIPAGGQIGIHLLDLSGADNTIQILFLGVKRYRLPQ
jgi:hypothetical protein